MHDVLIDLHGVAHAGQRAELHAKLVLSGSHLVVVLLGGDAHGCHRGEHLGADVLGAIDRGNREVAALGARTMAEVAHLVLGRHVGGQFGRIQPVAAIVRIGRETHVVENEELGFGAEVSLVANAGLLQISLGLAGDAARVALIALVGGGLKNVAEHCQRRLREERVQIERTPDRASASCRFH